MIDFLVSCGGGRKTVVTATHDLDLIEDIADNCHVFQRGRIVATGTPAEILNDEALLLRHQSHPRPSPCPCSRRASFPPASPRPPSLIPRIPAQPFVIPSEAVLRLRRTNESRDLLLAIAATLVATNATRQVCRNLEILRLHASFALRCSCFAQDDSKYWINQQRWAAGTVAETGSDRREACFRTGGAAGRDKDR